MTKPAAARPDRSRQAFNGAGEILPAIPRHLDFLFDERPLLPDEDPGPYDTLLSTFVQQVRPADVIEAIWVKDIVDLIWETKRLRRWRRQILGQARLEAATKLALPVIEAQNRNTFRADFEHRREAEALALGWLEHDNAEAARMEQLLRARGLTAADVDAQAFQVKLPDLERIERMIASADHRRDALLREIERKRASLSQHVRAAAADVIDAESPPRESACAAQPRT